MNTWTDLPLTEEHAELLTAAAITPEVARGTVRSITTWTELPEGFHRFGAAVLPAMLFTWNRVVDDDEPVLQLRPDEPLVLPDGESKYLFPAKTTPVLAVHPSMRERVAKADMPLVVVEGTKQYLAAVSALDPEYAAAGVSGCYGWSSDGKPVPDLDQIPWTDRVVYIAFDADIAENRNVWEAAQQLTDTLKIRGVETIRYVKVPGGRNAGLDDVLGTLTDRPAGMRRLLQQAETKLPRKPARKKTRPAYFDEDGGLLVDTLATTLREQHAMALAGDYTVAVYRGGVYQVGELVLRSVVTAELGDLFRPAHRAAVEEYITSALFRENTVLPERAGDPVLNVTNGMLDLRTAGLKPHGPAWLSTTQLPVAWNPNATCPTYERWLAEQVGDQVEDLEEVAATMLDPSRTPSKALFLFGPSRSGKGTFLRLMKAIAGVRNVSAVTLHQLADDRFASANVYAKVLNTAADLSSEHVHDLSTFKMLTGEDLISANRKYGKQFTFTNQALFAFSANEVPTVSESSRAYFERMKPFKFARSFAGREDPGLEAAMMAELPGILARWVRAWQRFHTRGGYAATNQGVQGEFEADSDRVHKWVAEECQVVTQTPAGSSGSSPETLSPGSFEGPGSSDGHARAVSEGAELPANYGTTKAALYEAFCDWATTSGMARMNRKTFLGRLTCIGGVREVRVMPNRTRALNVIIRGPDDDLPLSNSDSPGSTGSSGSFSPPSSMRGIHRNDLEEVCEPHGEGCEETARTARAARTPGEAHPTPASGCTPDPTSSRPRVDHVLNEKLPDHLKIYRAGDPVWSPSPRVTTNGDES